MNEKRKEHRLRANLAIKLTWGKEKELLARTENISRLGTYDLRISAASVWVLVILISA